MAAPSRCMVSPRLTANRADFTLHRVMSVRHSPGRIGHRKCGPLLCRVLAVPASAAKGALAPGVMARTEGGPGGSAENCVLKHGATKGLDVRRHLYWRQPRDMKGSALVEAMTPLGLTFYAGICGWTLARAHARSGDPVAIALPRRQRHIRPVDHRLLAALRQPERTRPPAVRQGSPDWTARRTLTETRTQHGNAPGPGHGVGRAPPVVWAGQAARSRCGLIA